MYDFIHNNMHCPGLKSAIEIDANFRFLRRYGHIKINDKHLRLIPTVPMTQMTNISEKVSDLLKLQITRHSLKSKLFKWNDDNFSNLSESVNSNSLSRLIYWLIVYKTTFCQCCIFQILWSSYLFNLLIKTRWCLFLWISISDYQFTVWKDVVFIGEWFLLPHIPFYHATKKII